MSGPSASTRPLLEVQEVYKHFRVGRPSWLAKRESRVLNAVNGVSFSIQGGEAFGLVGESGSGKSTLARMILRLSRPTSGSVRIAGRDIWLLSGRELRQRRRLAQAVFQDPKSSLNPRLRIRSILAEPLVTYRLPHRKEHLADLLALVGLSAEHLDRFPHQLSGGQRQRVALARALALQPKLLVADEPVSALDVSVQAQILNLLKHLQQTLGLAVLLVSHDIGVVGHFCDRVGVMYFGEMMELGPVESVLTSPNHPYTQTLIEAVPDPDPESRSAPTPVHGELPNSLDLVPGCVFHTRCPAKLGAICEDERPLRTETRMGGWAACHLLGTHHAEEERSTTED